RQKRKTEGQSERTARPWRDHRELRRRQRSKGAHLAARALELAARILSARLHDELVDPSMLADREWVGRSTRSRLLELADVGERAARRGELEEVRRRRVARIDLLLRRRQSVTFRDASDRVVVLRGARVIRRPEPAVQIERAHGELERFVRLAVLELDFGERG